MSRAKYLADWQVSALLSMAADGRCPCCAYVENELRDIGLRAGSSALAGALDLAGCTQQRDSLRRGTAASVLRELERAGLVRPPRLPEVA